MRRILFSLMLALGIHGLLLGMEFDGLKQTFSTRPAPRDIAITLTYMHQQRPVEKPAGNKFIPDENNKPDKQPDPVVKPVAEKKIKAAIKQNLNALVQPEKKRPTPAEPAPVPETPRLPETTLDHVPAPPADHAKTETSSPLGREPETPAVQTVRQASPMYLRNSPPRYPKIARKRGYRGTVVLEVLVDRNGNVGDLRVFESSGHKVLDKAAVTSVKDWVFEPGMRGNETVDMWVKVPIRFELK